MSIVESFEAQVPEQFDEITLDQRVEDRNPYVCVVLQEVERMNKLMFEITRSLAELKLGLLGALNMSDLMEALLTALGLQQVPANWNKVGYPSLKSLGPWFSDMLLRQQQLATWTEGSGCPSKTVPKSVWISGMFNPMAYITAVLQTTARKTDQPLDQMYIWTDITTMMSGDEVESYAEDGMYIHGMYMEGARWDTKKGVIAESFAKDLHPVMPVINVRGIMYADVDLTGIFECPIYVTTKRGATFTCVATLKSADRINKWVLAGVAIMMSDDIAG
jgi:dynein heavy chain